MSEVDAKVARPSGTVVLNRPDKRNALTREVIRELDATLTDLHQDTRVRAVILTGAGDSFCAGLDLQEMLDTSTSETAMQQWHEDVMQFKELLATMMRFPKPIIAAVNGPVVGGGVALALACDMVVGAQTATLSAPEPKRGIVSGILAPLMCFRVGSGHTSHLLLTAKTIDAAEAHRIGLYHEVVSTDLVWARSQELAQEIATLASESLQLTKRLLNETIGEQLSTQLSLGAAASATSRTTEAAQEGIQAFLDKREPEWP